jgi:hypothetical protein
MIEHLNGMTSNSSAQAAVVPMERRALKNQQVRLRQMACMRFAPSLPGNAESLSPRQFVLDLGAFVADLLQLPPHDPFHRDQTAGTPHL